MKRWLFLTILCSLWGCSGGPSQATSATSSGSSGSSSGGGGQPAELAACPDSPDALPRPPSGTLPCEYIPPGLTILP